MKVLDLIKTLDEVLESADFKDVSYNGLQVQADPISLMRDEVEVVCTSADASYEAINAAIAHDADLLLVHHGLYWRGADPRAVGVMGERLRTALETNLNIAAYHLPLDASMRFGNNANLCRLIGAERFDYIVPGDKTSIAMRAQLKEPLTYPELCRLLATELDTKVELLGVREWGEQELSRKVTRAVVCSGSGSSILEHCPHPDFDVFITGDVSEQIYEIANELALPVIAAGHHATEQSGVKALGDFLAEKFGIEHIHLNYNLEKESIWY